jgi:tetratricopeptide (TPR) repeat protein
VALGAGLLAAALGPVLFYEGQVGVDALMPPLVMSCAALVLWASRGRGALAWGLVGVAVGVTALGRAVALAWMPLLLGWALARRGRRWRRGGGLLLGAALVIAPVTLRNLRAEGDFVLITANGGLNFFIGNHDGANGAYVFPAKLSFRAGDPADDFAGHRAAEQSEGRALTSREVSAWWSRRAWAFVRAEPARAAGLAVEKAKLLASDAEYMQLHDYGVYREVAPVLRVLPTAGFVTIPGLAGVVVLLVSRARRPLARRLAALALVFAASFLPFFVVGRYRAPWLLLLAPFAASFAGQVVVACRGRRWRSLLAPVALAAVVAWVSTRPVDEPSPAFEYLDFAHAALARGDPRGAAHWCERSLSRDPARVDAAALLGRLRREEGRYEDAERVLTGAVSRDPHEASAWLELGRVRIATGRLDAGIDALLEGLNAEPRSLETWRALADALHRSGRDDEAAAAERSIQRLLPLEEGP